ncbi:NGO1151 family protein [Snodgrassella sp. B3837]|uniref:NGO1151 family protein n=1 Tax=Snodgrassella sp. B3837 TaxID=2818040 RepID=UPI00226A499F|nr:hypothetical protein [Snodgrassella sp. B3837]MCX8752495.1 hypothetical protein [Snodgrassella sp. B3837]
MSTLEQRIEFLEENNEALLMQNRVLATALKGLLRALPADLAELATESIRTAFDNEIAELQYEENPQVELFHDATYVFFHEREH